MKKIVLATLIGVIMSSSIVVAEQLSSEKNQSPISQQVQNDLRSIEVTLEQEFLVEFNHYTSVFCTSCIGF